MENIQITEQTIRRVLSKFCKTNNYNLRYKTINKDTKEITFQLKFTYPNEGNLEYIRHNLYKLLNVYINNSEVCGYYRRELNNNEGYYSKFFVTFSLK